jgi:hypothetical protein
MDRVSKELEILHHLDGMESLLVRVFRQQEGILYAVNQLHSEHARIMHEDAGMMSVLMERMDVLETTFRRGLARNKRRSDFG